MSKKNIAIEITDFEFDESVDLSTSANLSSFYTRESTTILGFYRDLPTDC